MIANYARVINGVSVPAGHTVEFTQAGPVILKATPAAMPNALTMAANALTSAIGHIANGARKVSAAELSRRMVICRGCELFAPADERCTVCGCYLSIKASWESETCPKGKW